MNNRLWKTFFVSSTLYNFSILLLNKCFTSNVLENTYPEVFSKFGQILIILYGFSYYYVYREYRESLKEKQDEQVAYILSLIVFFIQKMICAVSGIYWILYRSPERNFLNISNLIYSISYWLDTKMKPESFEHPLIWVFMRTYWISEFLFGIGFLLYSFKIYKRLKGLK